MAMNSVLEPKQVPQITPIDAVHMALNEASGLAVRIHELSERLLGADPTGGSEGSLKNCRGGKLGELQDFAEEVRNVLLLASVRLDRISAAL